MCSCGDEAFDLGRAIVRCIMHWRLSGPESQQRRRVPQKEVSELMLHRMEEPESVSRGDSSVALGEWNEIEQERCIVVVLTHRCDGGSHHMNVAAGASFPFATCGSEESFRPNGAMDSALHF